MTTRPPSRGPRGATAPTLEACREVLHRELRPEWFRALGDPTRLQVLRRLAFASRPLTVGEVAGCCGVHLSGVSRHLALLRSAGIVQAERAGREVRYRIERAELTRTLRDLADALEGCCETESPCNEDPGPKENET